MKVLFIGPDPNTDRSGGIVTHARIIKALFEENKNVLVSFYDPEHGKRGKKASWIRQAYNSYFISRWVNIESYDCVHINLTAVRSSLIKLRLLSSKIPPEKMIIQFHGGDFSNLNINNFDKTYKDILNNSRRILVLTKEQMKFLIKAGVYQDKVIKVPNFIDINAFDYELIKEKIHKILEGVTLKVLFI